MKGVCFPMRKHLTRLLSVAVLAALLLSLSVPAFAAGDTAPSTRIDLADGGYILVEAAVDGTSERGEVVTIYGHKYYYGYDQSGTAVWRATLTGTFTYDGSSSSCTGASLSFTAYDSAYYRVSGSAYPSGSSAVADFTVGFRVLGITVSTSNHHMTLSCDAYGNLS